MIVDLVMVVSMGERVLEVLMVMKRCLEGILSLKCWRWRWGVVSVLLGGVFVDCFELSFYSFFYKPF